MWGRDGRTYKKTLPRAWRAFGTNGKAATFSFGGCDCLYFRKKGKEKKAVVGTKRQSNALVCDSGLSCGLRDDDQMPTDRG